MINYNFRMGRCIEQMEMWFVIAWICTVIILDCHYIFIYKFLLTLLKTGQIKYIGLKQLKLWFEATLPMQLQLSNILHCQKNDIKKRRDCLIRNALGTLNKKDNLAKYMVVFSFAPLFYLHLHTNTDNKWLLICHILFLPNWLSFSLWWFHLLCSFYTGVVISSWL